MGGRGAGAGGHGAASRWTDEDLGIGGIMDDADGTITDRQLQHIRDLQEKLQEWLGGGQSRPVSAAPGAAGREGEAEEMEAVRERSRRLRALNPERLSERGASRFIDAAG